MSNLRSRDQQVSHVAIPFLPAAFEKRAREKANREAQGSVKVNGVRF